MICLGNVLVKCVLFNQGITITSVIIFRPSLMATSNVSHLNNADAAQQRERQDEYLATKLYLSVITPGTSINLGLITGSNL